MVNMDGHCCTITNGVSFDLESAGGLSSAGQAYLRSNSVKPTDYWHTRPAVTYISTGGILWTEKGWRLNLQEAQASLGWVSAGVWHVTDFVSPLLASYLRGTQNVAPMFWKLASVGLATSQRLPVQNVPGINIPTLCCSIPPSKDLLLCQLTHCLSVVKSSLVDNRRCHQKYTAITAKYSHGLFASLSTAQAAVRFFIYFSLLYYFFTLLTFSLLFLYFFFLVFI